MGTDTSFEPLQSNSNLSAWDKRSSQSVEQIHPDVTRFWLFQGQIVCYTLTSIRRDAIDAWVKASIELPKQWPKDRPYLSIHDISEIVLTPYMREVASKGVMQLPHGIHGRTAIIMPRSFMNQLIRLFVTVDLYQKNASLERQVFFRIEEAADWLKKALPENSLNKR